MSRAKKNAPAEVSGTGRQVWASKDGKTTSAKCSDSRTLMVDVQRAKERAAPVPQATTPPFKRTILAGLLQRHEGNDYDTQVERLLRALQALRSGVTTHEAREFLGVYHPAGRVMTLRQQGYTIETLRVRQVCGDGRTHVIALYVLKKGP